MWNTIKAPFVWVADKWNKFELWVAKIAPGFKTFTTTLFAMIGNGAFFMRDYISQLPMEAVQKYLTADTIVAVNLVLLTLIFWFRRLANKTDA